MILSTYFPQNYLKDYQSYKDNVGEILCGHELSDYIKLDESILIDPKLFFLVSYQLNLINQTFYTYFQDDFERLSMTLPDFVDCRCFSQGGRPESIIGNISRLMKEEIEYSEDDLKMIQRYFQKYLDEKLNDLSEDNADEIMDRLDQVSQECLQSVQKYLK
jgi:hypothetical protein